MKRVKKNKTVSNFLKIVKRNLSGIVIPVTTSRLHLFFFLLPRFILISSITSGLEISEKKTSLTLNDSII
jgi:hypothetical protein